MRTLLIGLLFSLTLLAQSITSTLAVGAVDQPVTPTDSPGGGTYTSTQSVTFSDPTATVIFYTNDGSTTPSCTGTGTLYTGAISTSVTTTYKVVGCNGIKASGILTTTYTINSSTPFITSQVTGTPRTAFDGCVGFKFGVGSRALTITSLGRWVLSGNSLTHTVSILDSGGSTVISATIVTSGAPANAYKYTSVTPTVLSASTLYYLVSSETSAGDQWNDNNSTQVFSIDGGEIGYAVQTSCSGVPAITNSPNLTYDLLNFQYTGGDPTGASTPLYTAQVLGTLRNNASNCVGTWFQMGATAAVVTSLGRWTVSGNSQTHVLYLVNTDASGNGLWTGAQVTVNASGATPAQYLYGAVNPAYLAANGYYALYSTEASAGDQFYDQDTTVTATALLTAQRGAAVGITCPGSVAQQNAANHVYVPANLKYH